MKSEELEELFDLNIAYTHSAGELADVVNDLAREVLALRQKIEAAKKLAEAVEDLIDESYGVAGLHRNGDLVLWDELCEGGRFEEWLLPLAAFRATGGEG